MNVYVKFLLNQQIPDNPLFVMTTLYEEDEGEVRVLGV
jgi:hypothetical protein